jgi:hypothetical protein
VPPLFSFNLDVTLTMTGQSADYWQGNYRDVLEWNPVTYQLLAWHPLVALSAGLLWAIVFSAIIIWWRHPLARVLAFGLTFGHALGSCSWLWRLGWTGMVAGLGVLIIAERLLTWSWRLQCHSSPPASNSTAARKPL